MASRTSAPTTNWDTFLSFCGQDTRHNFTSHLYSALDRIGIRTFRDDPELRSGDKISDSLRQVIQESNTYIVVLSENYASSSWCLDELVEILNCHNSMQRLVIPVFYNIEPSIVRHQTGSFEKAFKAHQLRFAGKLERLEKWRSTLRQVGDISGKHIHRNRSEADIINEIVSDILLVLNPAELPVAEFPVGLDSQIKAIRSLLSSSKEGVIKFGIYGMGGVGKTTLAKALYNQLLHEGSFKGSCFLVNVREVSGTFKGLESLQQQLINDVLRNKIKIEVDNVDKGIELIRARIGSRKVLLVIDDLEDHENFDKLVGPFASESVVIITTRNEQILDKTGVEIKYRYRVHELADAESLTLFSQFAFGDTKPNNTFIVLSKDILHFAGGLPLALKVFGSYLHKRSLEGWESYIENLRRFPNSSIQQRLIISLDALESDDPVLKKMFIDIACFFIGRRKKNVVEILETYYSYANHKVDILKKRSLLTINNEGELRMHDLLQDIGREIARNNSPNEPEKHSRLWGSKEVCDVFKKHKGTEAIEGIMLHYFEHEDPTNEVSFTVEAFSRMSKLRYLHLKGISLAGELVPLKFSDRMSMFRPPLKGISLTGNFEQTLEDLRWFCWEVCPLTCLPSDFCPQKLVILELPQSKMSTLWEPNKVSHVFENLKTLNMSCSHDLVTTPDFTKLPCLKTLNLGGCKSLEEVHESIGSLHSLISLDLGGCVKLRCLPDTICNLRALESLQISSCSGLEALPEELGNIGSLTEISAWHINVRELPDSIGQLSKLVRLSLYDSKIQTLPNTICNLRKLESLDIFCCRWLKGLPKEFGKIESLRTLEAPGSKFWKLPDSFGSLSKLVTLNLRGNNLRTLPDTIGNLISLETLDISQGHELSILPDQLWELTRLKELDLSCSSLLKKLPAIKSRQIASSLQKLNMVRSGITALPSGFSQLLNLEYLHLLHCCHLLSIAELPPNLKEINAYGCKSLERLPNLSNLKKLDVLNLTYCSSLIEIQGMEELTLKQLHLGYSNSHLLAGTLTKRLFQKICSGFGHEMKIWIGSENFPAWIGQSTEDGLTTSLNLPPHVLDESSAEKYTMCLDLPPKVSRDYLGVIICFKGTSTCGYFVPDELVKYMVIVPRSIFSFTEGQARIEVRTHNWEEILRTHVLYQPEIPMTDEHSSTIANELKLADSTLQDIFQNIAYFFSDGT